MGTFSFSPPINLFEEGKWLLAVTSFEAKYSVFKITDENKTFFSYYTRSLGTRSAETTTDKLFKRSLVLKMLLNYMLNNLGQK